MLLVSFHSTNSLYFLSAGAFTNAIASNIPPLSVLALVSIIAATSLSCEKSGTSIKAGNSLYFKKISFANSSPVLFIVVLSNPPIASVFVTLDKSTSSYSISTLFPATVA